MRNIIKVLTLLAITIITFMPVASGEASQSSEFISNGTISINGKIEVNGEIIQAPDAYIYSGDESIAMVPLRAVAQSLGLKVNYEQVSERITVGYGYNIWVGRNFYRIGEGPAISLNPAPERTDGSIFVPLDFFKYAIPGFDAFIADGIVVIQDSHETAIWIEPDNVASAWFSEGSANENRGESETIRIGKTEDSKDIYALLRLPLRADWLAGEITDARLFLKVNKGTPPNEMYIGTVTSSWSPAVIKRSEAKSFVDEKSLVLTEVRREKYDWVSVSVTDIVKSWLRNDKPNRGFALFAKDGEEQGVFTVGATPSVHKSPYLVVSGRTGRRPNSHGKFSYSKQPEQGTSIADDGNCMSYALRDYEAIVFTDLGITHTEVSRIFEESGEKGVLEYVARMFETYVERHKEGLKISNLRKINKFDAKIDAEKEYRIALRVSCRPPGNTPMDERDSFDYHMWMQLDDGRWAQKFQGDTSEIIPGSGAGISPVRLGWDAGRRWGVEKWMEMYASDAIYYAVTKDTDEFTKHK